MVELQTSQVPGFTHIFTQQACLHIPTANHTLYYAVTPVGYNEEIRYRLYAFHTVIYTDETSV